MSLFTQEIEVGSADLSRFEKGELLVDTGSTYTWIPRELVERLGLESQTQRQLRTADGRTIEREAVVAHVRLNGETLPNLCVVAESDNSRLLGSLTLETFSLGVDPINRKLVQIVGSAADGTILFEQ